MKNNYTIEMFSGTQSFSNVATKKGYRTLTIDNNINFNSDISKDINNLTIEDIPLGYNRPFILWMSPPCECFSVASIGRNWFKETRLPKNEKTLKACGLLLNSLKLMKNINPMYWFIENPRGMMRKIIPGLFKRLNIEYYRYTVSYCQYGDTRMKPTDIWTNIKNFKPKLCKNGDSCHISAPRGSKTGTQGLKNNVERGKIPKKLIQELMRCCEHEQT